MICHILLYSSPQIAKDTDTLSYIQKYRYILENKIPRPPYLQNRETKVSLCGGHGNCIPPKDQLPINRK